MKSKHQSLLILAGTALVATIAVAVSSTNNSALFNSFADTPSKDRTLVLDSNAPLSINGIVGTLTLGNIGVYVTNCESLNEGAFRMNSSCNVYLYCATAGLDGNNRFYGFGGATISSVTFVVNNHGNTAGNISIGWTKLNSDYSKTGWTSNTTLALESSLENQTKTISGSNVFLTGQGGEHNCIQFSYAKPTLDIISLTVEYTCK